MSWLTRPIAGVRMYERVRGRAYSPVEKAHIYREKQAVRASGCPFKDGFGCALGTAMPVRCQLGIDSVAGEKGFLPTLLAVRLDKAWVAAMIDSGEIANAKVAMEFRDADKPEELAQATQTTAKGV